MPQFALLELTAMPIDALGLNRMNAQDVSRTLFTRAAEILTEKGTLESIAVIFTESDCLLISIEPFLKNDLTKDHLSFILRALAKDIPLQGIALVLDVYTRPATEKEVQTGIREDNRPVSECENKQDAICVQCEWRDGTQYMLSGAYTKEKDENGIEAVQVAEPSGSSIFDGRFSDLFPPTTRGEYIN